LHAKFDIYFFITSENILKNINICQFSLFIGVREKKGKGGGGQILLHLWLLSIYDLITAII
jgi:hypothetical protein